MGKAQKPNSEDKKCEEKFKSIPASFLKVKGIHYLRKQANTDISDRNKQLCQNSE
jgi:hypothetical protein